MFEEARRLARSLRQPDQWDGTRCYLTHKQTNWSLWIGNGMFFLQPYNPRPQPWQEARPARYGLIEKLIIWHGGARRWHRLLVRENKRRARFRGDA